MKAIIYIILSFYCTFISNDIFSQTWEKLYGEPDRDDRSHGVIEAYDKGYLMAGKIENNKSWIIKTDINGNVLWEKLVERDGKLITRTVVESQYGGYFICGLARLTGSSTYPLPFIARFNECMEKEWCKIIQLNGNGSVASDMVELNNGDIVIVVNNNGYTSNERLYLFKLNAFGDVLWGDAYVKGDDHPASSNPFAYTLISTSDSAFLVTGDVYWENPWGPSGFFVQRSLFLKVDPDGNEEWVLPFGLQDSIINKSFTTIELSDGFIGVGTDRSGPKFQGFVMKYDFHGNEIEHRTIDFNTIDSSFTCGQFMDIQKIDSLYIIGGAYGDLDNEDYFPGELVFDTNIFEPDYNLYGYKRHLNTGGLIDMTITHDNKILTNTVYESDRTDYDIYLSKMNLQLEYDSIYTANFQYDSLCPGGIISGTISLDDCLLVVSVDDIPSAQEYMLHKSSIHIHIHPNPANNNLNFSFENTEHHAELKLECYDLFGRKVYETTLIKGQKGESINVSNWPAGLYVAVVTSRGKVVGNSKFVVQND